MGFILNSGSKRKVWAIKENNGDGVDPDESPIRINTYGIPSKRTMVTSIWNTDFDAKSYVGNQMK